MSTGSPDERLDCIDMHIAHLESQLVTCKKELAEAKDRLSRISGLCENCTNLSDAQAIARGQNLGYINEYGHYQTNKEVK